MTEYEARLWFLLAAIYAEKVTPEQRKRMTDKVLARLKMQEPPDIHNPDGP